MPTATWLAALGGRLSFFTHLASGHVVTWKMASGTPSVCPGDIVCHECGHVLWCRAHDPWRGPTVEAAPDHWGAPAQKSPATLFDRLQQVLRLAEACPSGPSGDALRRAACELVEADSSTARTACRRRMLRCVIDIRGRPQPRTDDPNPLLLRQLTDALRRELWAR